MAQLYTWTGRDRAGRSISGRIQAAGIEAVRSRLRRQGLSQLRISQARQGLRQRIKLAYIADFARQLSALLSSGIPLVQALDIVATDHPHAPTQELLNALRLDVENGERLSSALTRHPQHFNSFFCSLVEAGEQTGRLEDLVRIIAQHLERTDALRRKVRGAMIYPSIVLGVGLLIACVLLIYVIPTMQTLFDSAGKELPALTQTVLALSAFLRQHVLWLVLALAGICIAGRWSYQQHPFLQQWWHQRLLKLPLVHTVLLRSASSKFARTLSTMLNAGITIVDALPSASSATGNLYIQHKMQQVQQDVSNGDSLSASLQRIDVLPSMLIKVVHIGEQSGRLDEILDKVALYFEDLVEQSIDQFVTIIEPLIVLMLGVLLGTLIVAMYLPIFQLGVVLS